MNAELKKVRRYTHSKVRCGNLMLNEYEMRMLQLDVLAGDIDPEKLPDIICPVNGRIRINKDGGLTDTFGTAFYDKCSRIQYAMIQIQRALEKARG